MISRFRRMRAVALLFTISSEPANPQTSRGPVYVERSASVPAPIDHAFGGFVDLHVDATDVNHKIFAVRQRIPVTAGAATTLLYPRWEAASHGPSLTVTDLAGLMISAAGKPIPWQRDTLDPHAFHLNVPVGVRSIDVDFQMVAASDLITADIVKVPWQRLLLYPAGWYARNIPIIATLTLPAGLSAFTSLEAKQHAGDTLRFTQTSLEALLDAPVLAGRHVSKLPLTATGSGAVTLNVVATRPGDLVVPPERVKELKRLIAQTRAVFGPAPFRHYDILARLSDDGSAGGTEHRASSENELALSHFRDWPGQIMSRDLIAHEIVHAWNGFYRTPADLWAPTPNAAVSGGLLWMYEGQTEFWGRILATRAGQFTPAELRDRLAIDAAEVAARPGRAWRSLSDDVNYPSFMLRQAVPWRDWQRRRDYYSEGVMLWLAVDGELRKRSGGVRGIDDFASRFFAGATPEIPTRTYGFDDLCRTLDDVAPADWPTILTTWVRAHDELDTTTGLASHGWQLVFTESPTAAFRASEEEAGVSDLSYSIGLSASNNGTVRSVSWKGPAFRAGLRPGLKILAVNAEPYTRERLLSAVRTASKRPVVLTVDQHGRSADRMINYRGTLRYPKLDRIPGVPDELARLLASR